MTIQEKLEKYKEEHCSKCKKNIDCKIILENGEIYCTEEEQIWKDVQKQIQYVVIAISCVKIANQMNARKQ